MDPRAAGYSSAGVELEHTLNVSVSTPDKVYAYSQSIRLTPTKLGVYVKHMLIIELYLGILEMRILDMDILGVSGLEVDILGVGMWY